MVRSADTFEAKGEDRFRTLSLIEVLLPCHVEHA